MRKPLSLVLWSAGVACLIAAMPSEPDSPLVGFLIMAAIFFAMMGLLASMMLDGKVKR